MWYLYKHTNKTNNKSYIGKTENPEKRWINIMDITIKHVHDFGLQ